MSARELLQEMIDLLDRQTEAIIAGDHQALMADVARHEELLTALGTVELNEPQAELRTLYEQLERKKAKVQSLLESESARVDYFLRLLHGGGGNKTVGYPNGQQGRAGGSRIMNRRA